LKFLSLSGDYTLKSLWNHGIKLKGKSKHTSNNYMQYMPLQHSLHMFFMYIVEY
jgi:hypothetical protein